MSAPRQQIRFCSTSDGVRLAYGLSGKGSPIVKVANWITHLDHDFDSPVWGHLVGALSRDHLLVRYDQRGSGLSDWAVENHSFDAWVHDLETVVDAAGLERFPLLGISQGASIAVAYAVRHPERVTHLILHGGFVQGRLKRAQTQEARNEAEAMNQLAELGWGQENPAFRQFFTTHFIPEGTPEQHEWFNHLQRISTTPANAGKMMRASNEIDVRALLPQVQCPTLVLHSTREARVPFDQGRLFASHIAGARLVPLESCNHLLLEHEPAWLRWLEEVRDFLPSTRGDAHEFGDLTPREVELLELLATGRDNAQIAATLALQEKTIRNHMSNLYAKLQVENRSQAIVAAREAGFGAQRAK